MSAAPTPTSERAPSPIVPMRAIVQDRYGSADVLRLDEIPRPEVGPDDVLIEVRAAGVDRGVWHLVAGQPYVLRLAGFGVRAPKMRVPGRDVAGVVAGVGGAVTRFRPGDHVFGIGRGTFAEYALAPEDKLEPMPASLTFEQAAAVPISGLTALQGVSEVGRLEAGQRVLVVGASGGVGTFAVQIAVALGGQVTGVCSGGKADLVRSLGATNVLDYARDDFADGTHEYDLVVDIGGNSSLRRLRRALTPHGTLVIVGGEGGGRWFGGVDRQLRALALSPFVGQRLTNFVSKEHHAGLVRLTELVDAGRLVPSVDRTYPLHEMPDALRHLQAGTVMGKLVVVP
jgi:NADPH:quinone reductase-like Zn-dependent oxidoreductase